MQIWGGAGAEGPDTPSRGAPGAPEPGGGGRAHQGAQVPLGCSPLGGGPPALKVSEGLYQFSDDQMAGDFPCFDETTATRLRRLQAKDVQRLLRGFEGPQLKQGGLERVVEAFYIAKMKYEHEARLSTPAGWQARWLGVRGPGEPPPGQGAHILDLPLLHHALGEEGRHEVHGVRQEDGAH